MTELGTKQNPIDIEQLLGSKENPIELDYDENSMIDINSKVQEKKPIEIVNSEEQEKEFEIFDNQNDPFFQQRLEEIYNSYNNESSTSSSKLKEFLEEFNLISFSRLNFLLEDGILSYTQLRKLYKSLKAKVKNTVENAESYRKRKEKLKKIPEFVPGPIGVAKSKKCRTGVKSKYMRK